MLKARISSVVLCISLSACMQDTPDEMYPNYQPMYAFHESQLYPSGYVNTMYAEAPLEQKAVISSDTYSVIPSHPRVSHKDLDKEWVSTQKAQHYTIELKASEKPAQVANTLSRIPKDDRTAEIKYQNEGKTYYKGVYGSFPSVEAAQKALNNLPADVKQQADVKSWGSVQNEVSE